VTTHHFTALAAAAIAMLAVCPPTSAQSLTQPREPIPQGRRIGAKDGDLIVVDHDARVGFVRRRQATIRVIFNAADRWVVLLADFAPPNGTPDGLVDFTYNWRQLEGTWPLDERWEGSAILEDYSAPGSGPNSFAIVVPQGRVQFLNSGPVEPMFADPQALAVLRYRSGGSGMGSRQPFDQAEPQAVRNATTNASNASFSTSSSTIATGAGSSGVTVSSSLTATTAPLPSPAGPPSDPNAPVRVGSVIATPKKIHDVSPIYPESMRQSGVTGTVILELTTERDGSVRSVRLLRGIAPPIDDAALQAARQWRYEPVMLNGAPVPVILTASIVVKP
jgi:TonB family protein